MSPWRYSINPTFSTFKLISRVDILSSSCETTLGKCHRTSLMINQHWYRQWLGTVWQQAIIWTNNDPDLIKPQWVNQWMHSEPRQRTPPSNIMFLFVCDYFVIYVSRVSQLSLWSGHYRNSPREKCHYGNIIMSTMASQITGVSMVCSTFCSGEDHKKISKLRVTGLCDGNSSVTG